MSTHHSAPRAGHSDDDLFTLTMIGYASLGGILTVTGAVALYTWHSAVAWLVTKNVLVPAVQDPRITLPYSHGAGLDAARVVVLVAVLLLLLACLVDAVRRHRARRCEEQLG